MLSFVATNSELQKVLFMALSVTVLVVYKISLELLNRFAPNSQGRRVWFLAWTCLNVKAKGEGQGHWGQITAFLALSAACMQFIFGKTSLPSSCC